jgi:hypothetical protein
MAAADLDTINSTQNQGVQYLGLIYQALKAAFGFIGGTSATATGGAATLPANPVGFVTITLPNGQSVKVAYYT